ncbi:peptide-methionine (R)-S-oxide reductase MsrB [uncultured Salinisphaera sp.]|uniref:peptide-methionine (R)-S-oxide reductase MsrB n=1 Tax=uncultured Salinisphaera sp. TaxID=359372 RepID=UPI0032B2B55C|tara:strand:- start:43 stop:645 length:603 start_codon:yes stop_codon:yes gene_type:complete
MNDTRHSPNTSVSASRRRVLAGISSIGFLSLTGLSACARADEAGSRTLKDPVTIMTYDAGGQATGLESLAPVVKTPAEWRAQLSKQAYHITREAGTERPYTGQYYDSAPEHGLYRCVCCDTALYDSATQFHSGTGWPSFYQPVDPHNVTENRDTSFGTVRTEIACARCAAHLGHVFRDGPEPTGLRYCMNAAAMTFHAIS